MARVDTKHAGSKSAADHSPKPHKHSGVFVNSICTSTEPLFRETVRVKLQPAKNTSK